MCFDEHLQRLLAHHTEAKKRFGHPSGPEARSFVFMGGSEGQKRICVGLGHALAANIELKLAGVSQVCAALFERVAERMLEKCDERFCRKCAGAEHLLYMTQKTTDGGEMQRLTSTVIRRDAPAGKCRCDLA